VTSSLPIEFGDWLKSSDMADILEFKYDIKDAQLKEFGIHVAITMRSASELVRFLNSKTQTYISEAATESPIVDTYFTGITNSERHTSNGAHWLPWVCRIPVGCDSIKKVQIIIWDPKGGFGVELRTLLKGAGYGTIVIYATGIQGYRDAWRCGYIALWLEQNIITWLEHGEIDLLGGLDAQPLQGFTDDYVREVIADLQQLKDRRNKNTTNQFKTKTVVGDGRCLFRALDRGVDVQTAIVIVS
jgi:hypothetical protein